MAIGRKEIRFIMDINEILKISKEYIEVRKSRYKYTIKCKHCGKEYNYIRESKAIKNVLHGNSRKYHCTICGSYDLKVYNYKKQD